MTGSYVPHTVTFDCWQTLMFEAAAGHARGVAGRRIDLFASFTGVSPERAAPALAAAWAEHQRSWHRRVVFAGPEMTQHALEAVDVHLEPARRAKLVELLEDDLLGREVRAVDGARELLTKLRAAGVRTALICDTGFSPGRVVRQKLAHAGLLELLEVHVFSDEVRAPKPHARAFLSALAALQVPALGAIHVGDLRRTDVAGARAAGMGAVRFRGRNDDTDGPTDPRPDGGAALSDCAAAGCEPACERPEADVVVDTYAELDRYLTTDARARPNAS
jgi:FMN phosphatase YigB (HAD superfamily)